MIVWEESVVGKILPSAYLPILYIKVIVLLDCWDQHNAPSNVESEIEICRVRVKILIKYVISSAIQFPWRTSKKRPSVKNSSFLHVRYLLALPNIFVIAEEWCWDFYLCLRAALVSQNFEFSKRCISSPYECGGLQFGFKDGGWVIFPVFLEFTG